MEAQPEYLSRLLERSQSLARKIASERRRLLHLSREREWTSHRVVGRVVIALVEKNLLSTDIVDLLKAELLAAVEGNNKEFEALQGTVVDVTDLLQELSDPIE